MATPKIIPRANGEGSLGAATYGWGAGFITDATATSSTQGGSLTLAANDGAAAMGQGHRLGVIEFKGEEDASNTLTTGARIQSTTKQAWDATNNDAKLSFITTHANATLSEKVDIGGTTAMSVFNDYANELFENKLTSGQCGGEMLRYNPGGINAGGVGQIHFLETDGTWDLANAGAVATGGSQLLGVPSGLESGDLLLRGFARVPSTEILNTPGSDHAVGGLPVYVSTTAGHFDFNAPSASGDYVRIVGYAIDESGSDVLVYFDPDKTFVEIT